MCFICEGINHTEVYKCRRFNSLYMVLKIWISRETMFGHEEAIILHVRNGIDEKKCIPSPIVTDSSRKNPGVGTVVPKKCHVTCRSIFTE